MQQPNRPEKVVRIMVSARREFSVMFPPDADLAKEATQWPGVYRIEDLFGNTLWEGQRP